MIILTHQVNSSDNLIFEKNKKIAIAKITTHIITQVYDLLMIENGAFIVQYYYISKKTV
ncbi:MAG: hypothetical protein WCJ45_04305 [bacterium]